MQYHRTFTISAAHFNSEQEYEAFYRVMRARLDPTLLRYEDVCRCIENVHGHNFVIDIDVKGTPEGRRWLVDDADLVEIVRDWDNTNLSLHPDFTTPQLRATTENMAKLLRRKLEARFHNLARLFMVTVHETDGIWAREP